MWLYAFSSADRISTENFAFRTCASCPRIANFIRLYRAFLEYLKILINAFLLSLHMNLPNSLVRSMKAKLSHRIRKSSHVRTIKIDPRIAYITAPAQKSSFSEKYCTLVQTSAEKIYAIQNENQKTLSLLPCSKPAGYSNLAKNHPPSLRRYRDRQRSSLHSDRQLSDTKHALAGMDGRVCASQVAERSM